MSLSQYLHHYAEADTILANDIEGPYQHVLCIPAFDEPDSLLTRLEQIKNTQSLLIILVVNAPEGNSKDIEQNDKLKRTQHLAIHLKNNYSCIFSLSSTGHLLSMTNPQKKHLLLIEHCHTDNLLPKAQGVGLARKIACDLACQLIHNKVILSPWIHSSDADVNFPTDYFKSAEQLDSKKCAAALYPFIHSKNKNLKVDLAQSLYEFSLYYYVESLTKAGSPYAFHTIGSTLLINHQHYAQARGFPKRAAGEDFYLLNKLAKTGNIISLDRPTILIESRVSDRVPFGTGPALAKISTLNKPITDYLFYHPLCFLYLQQWLNIIPRLWHHKDKSKPLEILYLVDDGMKMVSPKINLSILLECLIELRLEKALTHAYQHSKSKHTFIRHMNNWFDAFRTLKFIHYLRDNNFSSINALDLHREKLILSPNLEKKLSALVKYES